MYGERNTCPEGATQCEDIGISYPIITRCSGVIRQDEENPSRYFCDTSKEPRAEPICLNGYVYIEQSPRYQSFCQKCPVYDPQRKRACYRDPDNKCKLCPDRYAKRCTKINSVIYMSDGDCLDGYKVYHKNTDSDRECVRCPAECEDCGNGKVPEKNVMKCDSCYHGYYLHKYECFQCMVNCKTCTNQQECTKCNNGFGLDSQNLCTVCPANCSACHFSDATERIICDACTSGYGLDKNASDVPCKPCPAHCIECFSPTATHCHKCDEHYAQEGRGCTRCAVLKPNCATCSKRNDKYACFACINGYILKNNITGVDAECIPVPSALSCLGHPVTDPPPRCNSESCVNGSSFTHDYRCEIRCYQCGKNPKFDNDGSFIDGHFYQLDLCKSFQTEPCSSGSCYGVQQWHGGELIGVIGGCLPHHDVNCTYSASDNDDFNKHDNGERYQCCNHTRCNDWLFDEDELDQAVNVKACLLVLVFAVTAIFL